jgi:hypothetical protein
MGIGTLLVVLMLATEASSIATLVLHQKPDSSNASLIISASALGLMFLIWLPKHYLAKVLDSSTMQGEATCSLSCIQLTFVLFVGSLTYKFWKGGWWVDGATSIVLGGLFAREGVKMLRWARSDEFTGGCCTDCHAPADVQAELDVVHRDICKCCSEKEDCKISDQCQCSSSGREEGNGAAISNMIASVQSHLCSFHVQVCCSPITPTGNRCCTREILPQGTTTDRIAEFQMAHAGSSA